ncbi:energy transducer TonB [Microbulbifer bruguierae]|uniref:Energy transducer TonB n=1 Tax=Microbulbifer bruguierae TaxID=3029061 RepID=A0ABY8NBB7_9GAMM|nr:energy transducer TonB [Microbulbifer bruguierae]WGL16093.1 energy transducer TonB [Microbulbifer bruguierae]
MNLRLTVMVICSLALHGWLLWAAPAPAVTAPSGSVALKLGQLKLAAQPPEVQPETAVQATAIEPVKPEPVKKIEPSKPKKKTPEQVQPVGQVPVQPIVQPVDQPDVAPLPGAETPSASAAAVNTQVATAPQSRQQSVGDEPVLVERPAFARPPAAPVYPELARQRRQQGTVIVEVRLDRNGAQVIRRLLQSSGVDSLDEAALQAVESWHFLPYKENGRARLSRVRLPIRFSL